MFDRINAQKGLFVYQPYFYSDRDGNSNVVLSSQEICPDVLIEIDNYEECLKEINWLGFNVGTLYGDLDNIAKAVVDNYKIKNGIL